MRTKSAPARRAFTLIEILMAMAIFGLVLSAIYSTWMAIMRGSQVASEVAAQVQRERVAMHTIEQALTSARSFVVDVQHYGFVAENGSEAMLSFVARLPKSFPRSGRFGDFDVRRIAFAVENGPESKKRLVLRQCPLLMEFDQDEIEHPLVLAKNVKELLFEFWDPRLGEWADTWAQTNQLPKMIRVTLQMLPPNQSAAASARVEEAIRIISLPSVAVPANWQTPNQQPNQPGQQRLPPNR